MDSRLRDARERSELVLLKAASSARPVLSAELDRRPNVLWRERRMFPIHPDICECATDSLSPK